MIGFIHEIRCASIVSLSNNTYLSEENFPSHEGLIIGMEIAKDLKFLWGKVSPIDKEKVEALNLELFRDPFSPFD